MRRDSITASLLSGSSQQQVLLLLFLAVACTCPSGTFVNAATTTPFDPSRYLCQQPGGVAECTECEAVCENTCLQDYLTCGPALTTCQGIKADCDDDCQVDHRLCELVAGLPTTFTAPTSTYVSKFPASTCPALEIITACSGTDFEGLLTGTFIPVEAPTTCTTGTTTDSETTTDGTGEGLASVLSGETPLYRTWYPDSLDEANLQFRYTYLYRTGNVQWAFRRNVVSICDPLPESSSSSTADRNTLTGTGTFIASVMQPHLGTAGSILCSGNAVGGQVFVEETPLGLCCTTSGEGNACGGDAGLSPGGAPATTNNAAPAGTPTTPNGGTPTSTPPAGSSSGASSSTTHFISWFFLLPVVAFLVQASSGLCW